MSALPDLLAKVEALLPAASLEDLRVTEASLAALRQKCCQRLQAASSAQAAAPPAPASSSSSSIDAADEAAGMPALPPGCVIGDFVLANGLHAGQRGQFKALLVARRPLKPEFLVKYVADIEGRTMELLLPEVKNTYVQAHDLQPWPKANMSRTPSSAKTRGQQASRAESADAPSSAKRKRKSGTKHVRFDDHVVIHDAPPVHLWEEDGSADDADDDQWLRMQPASPQEAKRRRVFGISDLSPTGTADGASSSADAEEARCAICGGGATGDAGRGALLQCTGCGLYSHLDCLESKPEEPLLPSEWRCADCARTGSRVGEQYQCLVLPDWKPLPSPPRVAKPRRRLRSSSTGGESDSTDGGGTGSHGDDLGQSEVGWEPRQGYLVPQREVEVQMAKTAALALSAAAYGIEMHSKFRDDECTAPVVRSPKVDALLRLVPIGAECWCHSHGVSGVRERFRARLIAAKVQHVVMKFLADERGRTVALCLPAPLVQTVPCEEVIPFSQMDLEAQLAGDDDGGVGANGAEDPGASATRLPSIHKVWT